MIAFELKRTAFELEPNAEGVSEAPVFVCLQPDLFSQR